MGLPPEVLLQNAVLLLVIAGVVVNYFRTVC